MGRMKEMMIISQEKYEYLSHELSNMSFGELLDYAIQNDVPVTKYYTSDDIRSAILQEALKPDL